MKSKAKTNASNRESESVITVKEIITNSSSKYSGSTDHSYLR